MFTKINDQEAAAALCMDCFHWVRMHWWDDDDPDDPPDDTPPPCHVEGCNCRMLDYLPEIEES